MPTPKPASRSETSFEVAKLVQEAVRAERERLAEVLHATTCQDITGAYLMVCATARQCRRLAPEVEQKLNGLAKRLQEAGSRLGIVVHSLELGEPNTEENH